MDYEQIKTYHATVQEMEKVLETIRFLQKEDIKIGATKVLAHDLR